MGPGGPRPRVGELLRNTGRLVVGCMAASASCSAPAPPGWSSAPTCPAGGSGGPARRAAGRAGVRQQLRLGLADLARRAGFGGALLIVDAVLLPARLPAGRRGAARPRPGAGGDRASPRATGPGAPSCRVMLPQLRPALSAARCWSALHLLAEFGALQLLRFQTFTTAIYDQYRSASTARPRPCWPACWCCCCLVLLLLELRRPRPPRATPGSARASPRAVPRRPGSAGPPCRCSAAPGRRSSAWPSACRWAASSTGCCVGTSTAFPVGELRQRHRAPRSASALVGAAAHRCRWPCRSPGSRCATAAGSPRAARAQHLPRPTRCPASSSRWRW